MAFPPKMKGKGKKGKKAPPFGKKYAGAKGGPLHNVMADHIRKKKFDK